MISYWMDRIARIAAALAVAAFFSVAIWVIVPYRQVPSQTAALTKPWAAAAPKPGSIDALTQRATEAIPSAQSTKQLIASAAGVLDAASGAVYTTANNLNRPCKGAAGPDACGTLAQANKTMVRISDEITETQVQQRGVLPHVTAAMDAFGDAAHGLNQDSADLHAVLASNQLNAAIAGLSATSTNMAAATGDFRARFHDVLYPPPCKTFGCRMERYVWPVVKDAGAFGDTLYWTHALIAGEKP
jgi:hypothetical protein